MHRVHVKCMYRFLVKYMYKFHVNRMHRFHGKCIYRFHVKCKYKFLAATWTLTLFFSLIRALSSEWRSCDADWCGNTIKFPWKENFRERARICTCCGFIFLSCLQSVALWENLVVWSVCSRHCMASQPSCSFCSARRDLPPAWELDDLCVYLFRLFCSFVRRKQAVQWKDQDYVFTTSLDYRFWKSCFICSFLRQVGLRGIKREPWSRAYDITRFQWRRSGSASRQSCVFRLAGELVGYAKCFAVRRIVDCVCIHGDDETSFSVLALLFNGVFNMGCRLCKGDVKRGIGYGREGGRKDRKREGGRGLQPFPSPPPSPLEKWVWPPSKFSTCVSPGKELNATWRRRVWRYLSGNLSLSLSHSSLSLSLSLFSLSLSLSLSLLSASLLLRAIAKKTHTCILLSRLRHLL